MEPTETVAPGGEAQSDEVQFEPGEREEQELSPLDAALARVAEAEGKRDEYLADLQRLAADFDNFRKWSRATSRPSLRVPRRGSSPS